MRQILASFSNRTTDSALKLLHQLQDGLKDLIAMGSTSGSSLVNQPRNLYEAQASEQFLLENVDKYKVRANLAALYKNGILLISNFTCHFCVLIIICFFLFCRT